MSKTLSTQLRTGLIAAALSTVAGAVALVQSPSPDPSIKVKGDDITIRGCVAQVSPGRGLTHPSLVWTRSDIMLSNALSVASDATTPLAARVFYWLDDEDALDDHLGQQVEITGELGDFKKGEVEVDREGEFTDIEMKLGDKKEKARLPTAWLGAAAADGEVDVVTRKVDVDKVKSLGPCVR